MQNIPFVNLGLQNKSIKKEIDLAIQSVIMDSAFSGGRYVAEFEKHFAKFSGAKYAVGVNSGTSALHLAMIILGIGPDDEVIVPANTFIATAWAVSYVGATPVYVDCNRDDWQIDAKKIEEKISRKTKAIIGVHLFGQPFDVDAVLNLAKKYKLYLVEDCAQAHGAKYKGKNVGTYGEIGCFSFYPTKNLGALGEGGALVGDKIKLIQKARMLRNQGSSSKYHHDEVGYNLRMDGIQAAILDFKLKYLSTWNRRRQVIADKYNKLIKNPHIILRQESRFTESVYHLYVIMVNKRDKFRLYLQSKGVESAIHYPIPCHLQKAYKYLRYKKGDLPESEDFSGKCVSVPIYPELTNKQVTQIIKVINAYEE